VTRHAAHLSAEAPFLRAICLVVKSYRSNNDRSRQRAHGTVANFPRRPDAGVVSKSILLFFIGRNRNDLWIAREAEGRTGGVFLLKRSALHFAQRKSAPVGCATMFLAEPIELDTENPGNPWARWLDWALRGCTSLYRLIRRPFRSGKNIEKGIGNDARKTKRTSLVASAAAVHGGAEQEGKLGGSRPKGDARRPFCQSRGSASLRAIREWI
jgi:hypothetical protein